MNAKVTYYEAFSDGDELPTIKDVAEYVADDLGLEYSAIEAELTRMDIDQLQRVDENMFLALYFKLDEEDHQQTSSIKADWSLFTSKCGRCSRRRLSKAFLCSKAGVLRSHCFECRGDDPIFTHPTHIFCRMDVDIIQGERLTLVHLMNMESAAAMGRGVDCCYVGRCTVHQKLDETPPLRQEMVDSGEFIKDLHGKQGIQEESREAAETRIKDILYRTEGYRYTNSKLGTLISRFICTQRSDTSRTPLQQEKERKRRKRESVKLENCGGVLTIKFSRSGLTTVSCFHEYVHESISQVSKVTAEVDAAVQEGVQLGLSPFQIVANLNREGNGEYTWSQVYYRWSLAMERRYKSSPDVGLSARTYLANSERFTEIFYTQEPFALGFICEYAQNLCKRVRVGEAFIDSTFKTNSSRLELFAVLGSFLGTGFPIAYLLLQPGVRSGSEIKTARTKSVEGFLEAVRRKVHSFRPIFFFTDKDFGQITAISNVYRVLPSICFWHMKRAIKRKLDQLGKDGVEETTNEQKAKILDFVTQHFNSHPFFSGNSETIESLYQRNLREIETYCREQKTPKVYAYLFSNWYDWNRYLLWGRRDPSAISFTRTTMTIEAHWSVVKRQYLVHNNRPRLDFLLYILDQRVMPKVEAHHALLFRGLKKPRWWYDFTREWTEARKRPIEGSYVTNTGTWTCTCPAYLRSRFLFCKHLISSNECPAYRSLVRNRHPPFLQLRLDPERHIPDMGGELHMYHNGVFCGVSGGSLGGLEEMLDRETAENKEKKQHTLTELLRWALNHLSDLLETGVGTKQLDHMERNVLRRLQHYRERVEKSLRQRSAPKTWEHADTLFLP